MTFSAFTPFRAFDPFRTVRLRALEARIARLYGDAAWTFFHGPRVVVGGGKTFIAHGANGEIRLTSYKHSTEEAESFLLRTSGPNDHNVSAVGIRPDGTLLCAYSDHNDTAMRVRIGSVAYDVTSMGDEIALTQSAATYPHLFHLSSEGTPGTGRWYLFFRTTAFSGWGRAYRYSDDGGATWSAAVSLFANGSERPYMQVWGNGVDQLHFLLTDGHPGDNALNGIYHFKYNAGQWQDSAGADMGSPPFAPADATNIATLDYGWNWDLVVYGDGTIQAALQRREAVGDLRYVLAEFDGSAWTTAEIANAGDHLYAADGTEDDYGGGFMLHPTNPDIAYLSREIDGNHEVEKWTRASAVWSSEAITAGSVDYGKQFRPVPVPSGPLELVWTGGSYNTYTDYSTSLFAKGRFLKRTGLDLDQQAINTFELADGVLVDASDHTTLFQDAAGTIPADAADDPVRLVVDKSGRGRNLVAPSDDARPLLKQDASGNWFLRFDGTDDILVHEGAFLYAAGEASVFVGVSAAGQNDKRLINEGYSGNTIQFYTPCQSRNTTDATNQQLTGSIRAQVGGVLLAQAAGPVAFNGVPNVLTTQDTGSSMNHRVNAGAYTEQSYSRVGATSIYDRFAIGALQRASAVSFFAGDVYAVAAITKLCSTDEVALFESWVASKTGTVLP